MKSMEITYPETNFWDSKAEKIEFVNHEDFREERLLKILGIDNNPLRSGFGVTNPAEILKRQEIAKFLMKHPETMEFLLKNLRDKFHGIDLPQHRQDFLDYFNPEKKHNPFWQLVDDFLKIVSGYHDVPAEISELAKFLDETKNLENDERKMADEIAREIQKAIYLEGTLDLQLENYHHEFRLQNSNVFGFQKYAYHLSNKWSEFKMPEWTEKKLWSWAGFLLGVYSLIHDLISSRLFYTPLLISKMPSSISEAIKDFFTNMLKEKGKFHDEIMKHSEKKATIKIFFRYSDTGLEIRLLNVWFKNKRENYPVPFIAKDFPGYQFVEIWKIDRENQKFNYQLSESYNQCDSAMITQAMVEKIPDILHGIKIESKTVEQEFRWRILPEFYNSPKIKGLYQQIQEYRDYFSHQMKVLQNIAKLLDTLMKKSKQWKKPLSFPEILPDSMHLISFDTLEPIHLIGEKKLGCKKELRASELIAIKSLPPINGQLLGFTGQNAGGKSATKETIVNDVFLSQSGLPIFAKRFKLNPKRKIALVFLDRGSESTIELLLRKTKLTLEALNGSQRNGVLLILDEVGTGTQEIDGLAYGRKLLQKLAGEKCSVIFSTQITDLAKFAQDELGAQCFAFDLNHQIKAGIGKGGIEKLMVQIGLDKILN